MMTNADKTAFPGISAPFTDGLSKREFFCAMALSGLCASNMARGDIADRAIQLADETLTQLEKTK